MLPLLKWSLRNTRCLVYITPRRNLSLHEYQAQSLLAGCGVPVPKGTLVHEPSEAKKQLEEFGGAGVVKAQILAGGRGKGVFSNGYKSGVHVVSSPQDGETAASNMLGQNLVTKQTGPGGLPVDKVYVVQKLDVAQEYYLAITIDRSRSCPMLIMSKGGGVGIEELAARDPNAVVKIALKYSEGITDQVVSTIVSQLGLGQNAVPGISEAIRGLYTFFKSNHATLVEINPLVLESGTGRFLCADSKVSIDNSARKIKPQVFAMRDTTQERQTELEAEKHGLVYVQLEGNIGCLVNGAGLAMATNDAVAHYGGNCANFLDGGGQATKETMVKAFELILSDTRVNTILVNIYGGIIRCDMIAEAIIGAAENFRDIPVVVRLQGTNSEEGQRMIAQSGLKLFAEDEFGGAIQKAIQLAGKADGKPQQQTTEGKLTDGPYALEQNRIDSVQQGRHQQSARAFSTVTRSSMESLLGKRAHQPSRSFATHSQHQSYQDTAKNLAIGPHTRVIYQGFTGRAATTNAAATLAYGTNIVGGVSPTATRTSHLDLPVYATCREAMSTLKPDATAVFVPAHSAGDAILEAIEAEIPLIVSVAEHIPVHHMLRVQEALQTQSKSRLVGPNCPGIIAPPAHCRIGIMPHLQYLPGVIGIASKSGTLSYEAVGATTRTGLGQSLCIGVGGDMLPGTSLVDALRVLVDEPRTQGIVVLGEIGGEAEMEAAAFLKDWRQQGGKKPVIGMVTGRTAPKGRTMGHAGAVAGGGASAEEKVRALEEAGAVVPVHPGEIGWVMKGLLEGSSDKAVDRGTASGRARVEEIGRMSDRITAAL